MPALPADVFIFYFDLIGVVADYAANPQVLSTVTDFQRAVRGLPTRWSGPNSFVVTAFDSVFVRVNASDAAGATDYAVVEFAADTIRAAEQFGFEKYFGAVTRGDVAIDPYDQTLVTGADPTDIQSQHLSILGDPQVRAAFAEKWSADLAKQGAQPFGGAYCVWVSEEVFDPDDLPDLAATGNPDVRVLTGHIDLAKAAGKRKWPFAQSRFSGIRPR